MGHLMATRVRIIGSIGLAWTSLRNALLHCVLLRGLSLWAAEDLGAEGDVSSLSKAWEALRRAGPGLKCTCRRHVATRPENERLKKTTPHWMTREQRRKAQQ